MFRNPTVLPFSGKMNRSRSDFRNAVFQGFKNWDHEQDLEKEHRVCTLFFIVSTAQCWGVLVYNSVQKFACFLASASEFMLSLYVIQRVCLCQMAVRSNIYCFKAAILRKIESFGFRVCSGTPWTHNFGKCCVWSSAVTQVFALRPVVHYKHGTETLRSFRFLCLCFVSKVWR